MEMLNMGGMHAEIGEAVKFSFSSDRRKLKLMRH